MSLYRVEHADGSECHVKYGECPRHHVLYPVAD
jgi:hypothetical protein